MKRKRKGLPADKNAIARLGMKLARRGSPFPGERAWFYHLYVRAERVLAPLRIITVLFMAIAWLADIPHTASALLMGSLVGFSILYSALAWLVVRRPHPAVFLLYIFDGMDLFTALTWVFATGGGKSAFIALLPAAFGAEAIHWPVVLAVGVSPIYAAAVLGIGGDRLYAAAFFSLILGVGLSIWNAMAIQEHRASFRDPLTGALGREYGFFLLNEVLAKTSFPFTLGIIDLDEFKEVNDQYGHVCGDAVLSNCTRVMAGHMRPTDLLIRMGGDEFVAIWPETSLASAQVAAERLREAVDTHRFECRTPHVSLHLTLSIGLTEAAPGMSATTLLRAADKRLYAAKAHRNQVAV